MSAGDEDLLDRCHALLRRLEWLELIEDDPEPTCPRCDYAEAGGHADDCDLDALIRELSPDAQSPG